MADGDGALDVPEKIKLGEVEYSMDELQGLVADGQFKREVETKQNTKLDKVMSKMVELTNEKKTWEQERAELEDLRKLKEAAKPATNELDEATIAKAREEARTKLGLFAKEDVENFLRQEFPKMYVQQRETDKFFETTAKLEKELDGTDGRPKFDQEEILEHMKTTGIRDPYKAYKDKNEDALDKWKSEQLGRSKRDGLLSDSSSNAGGKQPPEVRPTRDNLKQLFAEAIRGGK